MSFTVSNESGVPPLSVHPHQLFNPKSGGRSGGSPAVKDSAGIETVERVNDPVRCATTANDSLSGLAARDGVTPIAGDRIAAAFQSTGSQCGIYVAASGAWSRAPDEIYAGGAWEILEGTVYGNRQLVCTNDTNPLVGTDAITFAIRPGGTGTANRIAKWTGAATVGNSQIFDSGLYVSIPAEDASALGRLEVYDDTDDRSTGYFHKGHAATAFHAIEAASTSADSNGYTAWITNIGGGPGMFVQAASSGNGIDINVDGGYGVSSIPIGDGIAFNANRDVASVSNPLVRFKEEHVSASATTLEVVSDGSGVVGYFKSDSDAGSNPILDVLQDAPGGSVVRPAARIVNRAAHTSAHGVSVSADSGNAVHALSTSTGRAGYFHRNTSVGSLAVVYIHQDHSSNSAAALQIDNDGTGHGILINANNGGDAINAYSLAGGRAALFSRDQASATSAVVEVSQANATGSQVALRIDNNSDDFAANGIFLTSVGGIGGFFQSETNSSGIIYRNTNTAAVATGIVWQDHAGDANSALQVRQDGTGDILECLSGTTPVFTVEDDGLARTFRGKTQSSHTASASFTASADKCIYLIDTGAAAGNVTVTLPDDAAMPTDWQFTVKDIGNNASVRNIIVARATGDTYAINNVTGSYTIATNKRGATFHWDGSDIHVLHRSDP